MAEPMEIEPRVVGAQSFIDSMTEINASIRRTGEVSADTSKDIMRLNKPIWAMRRTLTGIRTALRMYNAALFEAGRIMRDVGFIGRTVVSMWQAHNIAQMRVAGASRDLRSAEETLTNVESELIKLEALGLEGTSNYAKAKERLQKATERVADAERDLQRAHQDNIVGYIGMIFQVGDLISRIIILRYHYQVFRASLNAFRMAKDAENVSEATGLALKWASVKATVASTFATAKQTAVEYAHTAALWLKAKALAVVHALTPHGWAILAVAGAVAAGTLAWIGYQQSMASTSATAKETEKSLAGSGVLAALQKTKMMLDRTNVSWRHYKTVTSRITKMDTEAKVSPRERRAETQFFAMHEGVNRSLTRSAAIMTKAITIHFSPTIMGGADAAPKDVYDEFIDALQRKGLI